MVKKRKPNKKNSQKSYKIYLFRHGQTYFNKKGIFTGHKESKLTKKGIQQAKLIAKKLKNKKFNAAFHTKLSRSKETLKYVLKYHPNCKKVVEDNRMIERSYGDLEGHSHKNFIDQIGEHALKLRIEGDALGDLSKSNRKKLEKFLGEKEYEIIHRGYDIPPPNGESFAMVEKRVKSFIRYLKKFMTSHKTSVAISAHGNSIRLFRKIMEHSSSEEAIKWMIPYDEYFEYVIKT